MRYSTHLLRHFRFVIGRNINDLRVRRNISLKKLSRKTGFSEELLDQYEIGKHNIGIRELLKIACALEVEVDLLVEGAIFNSCR